MMRLLISRELASVFCGVRVGKRMQKTVRNAAERAGKVQVGIAKKTKTELATAE